MKKMKKSTQRYILIGIGIAVILLAAVFLVRGIRRLAAGSTDTSEGVEYIKNAESADALSIEEKISRLESQDNTGTEEKSIKERFSSAVVMGDSIAAGFSEYDILSASSVVCGADVRLDQAGSLIERTKEMKPQILFLSLGNSDVTETDGDTDAFTERYGNLLDTLQTEMPDTHIFVNSIFPVQANGSEDQPSPEQIHEYNTALEELCDSRRVGFIDNTGIVEEQYYEDDGIHFRLSFFPVWAEYMAEVAAL